MPLLTRRLLLALPTLVLAALVAWAAVALMVQGRHSAFDWLLCGLFLVVMAWESLVAVQVALGFAAWARGPEGLSPLERQALSIAPVRTGRSRTAIVIPIFDEDVGAVFAAIGIMRRSLIRIGPTDDIDIHVLSDSRDGPTILAEEAAACRVIGDGPRVFYRRRETNEGRKAGNLAEFLERTRGRYDFMVVLDADSLMSGTTIRKLIRLMEENGRVALIQTISFAANRFTLFARIQQFAVRLYAPLSLKGMAVWQDADGLYYGHNAIIRCEPFLEHARLPILPGKPPLGGEILCHDVVEAALLRRAGWEVRVLPDLDGTWEEMPTNVVDLLGRERRWCQGNLQHLKVLAMPGLTPGTRINIALGILGYLVGPFWWAFLILGAVRALAGGRENLGVLAYGLAETSSAASSLFLVSAFVVLLPRVLNFLRALLGSRERRGFGGTVRLVTSAIVEQLFSALLTPMLSLITLRFVAQTFRGVVVPWHSQSRADRDVGWREAVRIQRLNLVVGAFLLVAALGTGGWYALWMLPTVLGLLLGPTLVVWSSRLDIGRATQRAGLFVTVDETRPAVELRELRA